MADAQDEVLGCKDYMQIMKGKRTKRQRPLSPLTLAMVSTSSTSAESGGEGERFSDNYGVVGGLDRPMAGAGSPTISNIEEFTTNTEEEEDMANCLILLAQGHTKKLSADQPTAVSNIATTTTSKAGGYYVYQCKTCNRCFPSFQALGGHRASHKKPKANNDININEEKKALVIMEEEDARLGNMNTTLSLQIANRVDNLCANNNVVKANKVHECSICGAQFSSGQALGGHMRRHRAFMSTTNTTTTTTALSIDQSPETKKRPRNILQLDLNLPAPEDHDHHRRESKFSFASKERVIVFSASSLVDCHY